jgi:SAM-dependent methyltransferase
MFEADREFVYFPLTDNTRHYIASLPTSSCESFLDIGAGCGAAALVQARYARTSVASDISARSTLFARFNAILNDLPDVQALQGSIYEPVAGRTFDRIGCHPPYDISSAAPWSFADGGDDGEFVIRGVVEGIPDHLAPGGEFIALVRASDRTGAPLEQRIRSWLGERHEEFDLAIVVRDVSSPRDYALASVLSTSGELSQARDIIRSMDEKGIEQLPYVHLIVRRKTGRSAPLTLRRELGARCTAIELEWLLEWESVAKSIDLMDAVLKVSPAAQLVVRHEMRNGGLRPVDYTLVANMPFAAEMQCPEWIAVLLSNCDGKRTTSEVYEIMKETGPIQPDQFCAAVKRLVSAGVLQLVALSH